MRFGKKINKKQIFTKNKSCRRNLRLYNLKLHFEVIKIHNLIFMVMFDDVIALFHLNF